jgi:hypothetical protein
MGTHKSKPIDLFNIEVGESLLHPNFLQTIEPGKEGVREVLKQWADGFVDRDGKLVKEFQTTYNSVFWELYLFALFKSWGVSNNFKYYAPDFNIREYGGICIEAVIANNTNNSDPEWINSGKEIVFPNLGDAETLDKFVTESTIRLSNAFFSKLKKFRKEYLELEHVKSKPFILAVAPFDRPWFYMQASQAISLLLYAKRVKSDGKGRWIFEAVEYVEKENGAQIDLGIFNNNSCTEISAVIFSNVATFGKAQALAYKIQQFPVMFMWARFNESQFGKPNMGVSWGRDYDESLDDGISIYLNPFASNPVPEGFVKKFQTIHRDVFEIESADNSLLTRLTHQFSFYDDGKTVQDDLEELNEMISKL